MFNYKFRMGLEPLWVSASLTTRYATCSSHYLISQKKRKPGTFSFIADNANLSATELVNYVLIFFFIIQVK